MKIGDLVVQLGWEADGVGIVTRVVIDEGPDTDSITVQWPRGVADMYRSQLKVIRERR